MQIPQEVIIAMLALGGAVIGALPGLITAILSRRAEDKKQMRELVMKTAAENWRLQAERANAVFPFEHYMIHTAMMCDLAFSGKKLTSDSVKAHLEQIDAVMKTLAEHAISVSKGRKSP